MTYALDHVLVCCSPGGGEAARLSALGLTEGSPNTHPGQGTASRRFFFANAYLELMWVADAQEARRPLPLRTGLWDRWSRRHTGACPFAVIVRPGDAVERDPPFPAWAYHPPYLPPPLAIDVAEPTLLGEPGFFHIRFARPPDAVNAQPRAHRLAVSRITAVEIALPGGVRSPAARAVEALGLVTFRESDEHLLTVAFDGATAGASADLRPELPLVLRWPV